MKARKALSLIKFFIANEKMEIIKGTTNIKINKKTAVSFGKFDGLHKGHKLLMDMLLREKMNALSAVAFSFEVHPSFLFDKNDFKVLTTNEEKDEVFSRVGIDYLVEFPFTKKTMLMEAEAFLKMIVSGLNVCSIIVGDDFRFGHNRAGDISFLEDMSRKYGYSLHVVEKVLHDGEEISSTLIRKRIRENDLKSARELLGYPYFMIGTVKSGRKLGRTIGIPTINIYPDSIKLLPFDGAYASKVTVDGKTNYGITNIGKNPTVSDDNPRVVETHIFDFDEDIYGKKVKIEFLDFLRPEKKFASIDELKAQIGRDIKYTKESFIDNL